MKHCILCAGPAPGLCEDCVSPLIDGLTHRVVRTERARVAADMVRDDPIRMLRAAWQRAGVILYSVRARANGFSLIAEGRTKFVHRDVLRQHVAEIALRPAGMAVFADSADGSGE